MTGASGCRRHTSAQVESQERERGAGQTAAWARCPHRQLEEAGGKSTEHQQEGDRHPQPSHAPGGRHGRLGWRGICAAWLRWRRGHGSVVSIRLVPGRRSGAHPESPSIRAKENGAVLTVGVANPVAELGEVGVDVHEVTLGGATRVVVRASVQGRSSGLCTRGSSRSHPTSFDVPLTTLSPRVGPRGPSGGGLRGAWPGLSDLTRLHCSIRTR
jgi:hypothetical protein